MAKTETLILKVDADTKAAQKSIDALEKSTNKLEDVTIHAKADTKAAEKSLQSLSKEGEKLEDITVKAKADTRQAERAISDLISDVDKLTSEDAIITLGIRGAQIQEQINDIRADLATMTKTPAEVEVSIKRLAELNGDMDQIQSKLKEIKDTKVDPDISTFADNTKRAKKNTDELSDAANKARNASANMWGNAAQDLGAFVGISGSAGVALGQLAEGAADARNGGEGLGTVFKGLAGSALPIVGLAAAVGLVGAAMKSANEQAKTQSELVKNAVDAWQEFLGLTDNLDASIQNVGESAAFVNDEFVNLGVSLFKGITEGDNATQDLREVNEALLQLGVVTADTTAVDFFRTLGGELALLGQAQQNLDKLPDLQPWQDAVAGLAVTVDELDPSRFGEITTSVSGLAAAFSQSAPAAAEYATEIAYAISQGDGATEIVDRLADALIASDKATAASAHDKAQEIYDGNKLIIDSFENLDDVVDSSVLNDFATDSLDAAAGSSLELASAILEIRKANPDASEFQVWQLLQGYIEDSDYAMRQFEKQVKQLNFDKVLENSDAFNDLVSDVTDGTVDLANFDEIVGNLAASWGISEEAVRQYILQEADKQIDAEAAAMEEAKKRAADLAAAIPEITQALKDINVDDIENIGRAFETALDDAGSFLDDFKFQVDFDEAFSGKDGFIEKFSGEFKPDILELGQWLEDHPLTVPGSVTWGELKADDPEFASLVLDMQSMLQEGAVRAFETGGTESAQAFVQAQAEAFAAATGMPISQVYALMGLPPDGSIQTLIKLAVDEESKADALSILDSLIGVDPNNPILAYIKAQVQLGNIDPQIAEIVALLAAKELGFDVTPQLKAFTPEQIAEAERQYNAALAGGVTIPTATEAPDTTATDGALQSGYWVNGIFVPTATEAPDTSATDTFFSTLFATPETKEVQLVAKSDSLGAIAKLLDAVANKKRTAKIDVTAPKADDIDSDLTAIAHKTRTAKIDVTAPKIDDVDDDLDELAEERDASIFARGANIFATDASLDTLAMPTEDGRIAHIFALASNTGPVDSALDAVAALRIAQMIVKADNAGQINEILDHVARDRFADITVRTHNVTVPSSGGTNSVNGQSVNGQAVGVGTQAAVAPTQTVAASAPIVVQTPAPIHANVTIKTAAVGSRYDVMRVVTAATKNGIRLGARSLVRTGG